MQVAPEVSSARPVRRVSTIRNYRITEEALPVTEICVVLVSLGLLLLTCVQISPVRELAVIAWLVSFALVGLRNTGAALGIYIAAVALYSHLHSGGQFSVFDRPDHAALLVLLAEIGLLRIKGRRWFTVDWLTLVLCAFIVYGLLNSFLTGTFSTWKTAEFVRSLGIPFLLVVLLLRARTTIKDLRFFFLVMFVVAAYSAVVSILWVTDLRELIFPGWITDPAVSPWADGPRAGGILIQPVWNGMLLSLVFCMLFLAYRTWVMGYERLLLIVLGAGLLVGVYLTYTRSAYVGMVPAVFVLFWQRTGSGRSAWKRLVLIGATLVGLSMALLSPPTMLESRVSKGETVVWRLEIWQIGLRMVPQRPLFGYGLRGYGENAAAFFESSDVLTRQNLEAREPAVHNATLNLMIEFGMVGFLLYAVAMYSLFIRAVRASRMRWGRDGVIWVVLFFVVYFVQVQFVVASDVTTNLLFYCTPALLGGLGYRSARDHDGIRNSAGRPGWPGLESTR